MSDYRIDCKTPGREWRALGTHRDDIARREYGMSAAALTEVVVARLAAQYPENEYRVTRVAEAAR